MSAYPYNCFEQRLSRIVALDDKAGWSQLASEIPAYMDHDGLLRYFPDDRLTGSEALTAYVLSVTAEAGLPIPDDARAKMIAALRAQIAGKLKHDYAWAADGRLLKVMSLGALARNNAATPDLLHNIEVSPQDMPTSILVDWLVALEQVHGSPTLITQAEHILRGRLVYNGTRIDLTDGTNEPWYAMSSNDEAAIKALDYALGHPKWSDDTPKMMTGVAQRQDRGHWDTTLANAWGSVVVRHFASLYPASAITGTTNVGLGGTGLSQAWPMPKEALSLRLPLPMTMMPLQVSQSGGSALPWAFVTVHAAVPLKEPLFTGYQISRTVVPVLQKVKGQWNKGDVMKVRITVVANAGRTWVVINDPVPPGATILNGLGGQSAMLNTNAGNVDSTAPYDFGSTGSAPSYVDRTNEGWHGFYEWVPHGTLVAEYTIRLNSSGKFQLPPTRVEAMYSPEVRGQLPNAPIEIGR
jgi:uncharacterized protein YfaS (alpha-2-macroglobulin family)